MAQTYAAAHLAELDEAFFTESTTARIVNKGMRLDFNGKNSVTIYNVDTVAESNYTRSGSNRFGALVELGTGTQTFTLSQDKAFTFTIDRGNLEDSQMAQEVGKAVSRQVREVSVPAVDAYRIGILEAYAVANSQETIAAVTAANAYEKYTDQTALLTDAAVPLDGRVCYMRAATYNFLKRDPEFTRDADLSVKDLKTGVVSMVDGVTNIVVPTSQLASTTEFLFVHEKLMVAPTKFDMVRTLDDVQGIDGWVAEGRHYYDAFLPSQKATSVRLHSNA